MVRKYKKKRVKKYSDENLLQAVDAVKTKRMNSYKASEMFSVPRSTIVSHVTGNRGQKQATPGKPTVFSRQQEEHLTVLIHAMEKAGHPMMRKEIKNLIGEYVRRNGIVTPFKNDTPGDDWCQGFMKRNNLSTKKPQSVEVARKNACNPFTIYHYYDLLESAIQELNLSDKPERIFNVDETSFCSDPSSSKIVGLKGYTSTRTTSGPGRDNTTVLLGASARGDKIPPLIVFKGKNLWNEWFYKNENVPTAYSVSLNGWMETSIFEKYIKDVFIPAIGSERPVLLVYDGHKTHVDLGVLELADANNITILKLPPHSSHVLQPLDCSAMKSMKVHWEDALVKWQRLHSGAKLPKSEFAKLLTETWDYLSPVVLQNGFRKAGLYPVNRNAITKDKFDVVAWSKWERFLKDGIRDEHIQENSNSKMDERKVSQTQDPVDDNHNILVLKKEVPSLVTLVLNNINDQQNSNIVTKIQLKKAEHIKKTGKNDLAKPVKNPSTFKLNPSKNNCFNKEIITGEPSVTILDCQILKKGDANYQNVTFEELLLQKIAKDNTKKNPKKRVQKGAEILTYKEVINSMKEEKEKKDLEIQRKETLKRIKLEDKSKAKRKRETNNRGKGKNKNVPIKKKKRNVYENSSDTDDTTSYSLKDSTDDEDVSVFYQSLLDEEKENDIFSDDKNIEFEKTHSRTKINSLTKDRKNKNEESEKNKTNNILKQRHINEETKKQSKKTSKEKQNTVKRNDYNLPSTSNEEPKPVFCQSLKEGRFVLVKFPTAKGKRDYQYVCMIEGVNNEKIVVKGFKSFKKNKKNFRIVQNDISIIDKIQIVSYLPTPIFDEVENVYVFPSEVAVAEL